jgi:tRNA nucleotidyltransferase (CCA-adding enzyme)
MAVLRHLHGRLEEISHPFEKRHQELKARRQDLGRKLERNLSPALWSLVERIIRLAREKKVRAYLVGGFVRDLLLGRENRDLDVVVEGDGPAFARDLAQELEGRVRVHEAFLSAVVVTADGQHIDVGTARSEFYSAPAELPRVQMSAIRQDLYRRDFTINTLCIVLGPGSRLELLDHFGALNDLQSGVIRVLHSLSFIDDPTRILRAVRLEQRLGFKISEETIRLARVALEEGVFRRLSGSRLRTELTLLLDDRGTAVKALERLRGLGLLPAIHPSLVLDEGAIRRMVRLRSGYSWYKMEGIRHPPVRLCWVFLLGLAEPLRAGERGEMADRLALVGDQRRLLVHYPRRLREAQKQLSGEGLRPHEAAHLLRSLTGEELVFLLAELPDEGRSWVRRYLTRLQDFRLGIRGADLVSAGVEPGPRVGDALNATRDARLDGAIGEDEELSYALSFLAKGGERR